MARKQPLERHCCDGQCLAGQPCPALAPGVIQGPYPQRRWQGLGRAVRATLGWMLALVVLCAWLAWVGAKR